MPWPLYPWEIDPVPTVLYNRLGWSQGLEWCGKSLPPAFDHRAVQALASGYFDYAIPARLMGTAATKMASYHASKSEVKDTWSQT